MYGLQRLEQQKKELRCVYHAAEKEAKQTNMEPDKLKQYLDMKQDDKTKKK